MLSKAATSIQRKILLMKNRKGGITGIWGIPYEDWKREKDSLTHCKNARERVFANWHRTCIRIPKQSRHRIPSVFACVCTRNLPQFFFFQLRFSIILALFFGRFKEKSATNRSEGLSAFCRFRDANETKHVKKLPYKEKTVTHCSEFRSQARKTKIERKRALCFSVALARVA